jgi:hypothetical protein
MPLDAVVTDISTLEETVRPLYTQKDGKFVLDVKPVDGFALEDIRGLRGALDSERAAKGTLESKLRAFDGLDPAAARQAIATAQMYGEITPDQAKAALADVARLTAIDPAKEADKIVQSKVDAAKRGLQGEFTSKENEYKGQIEALTGKANGLTEQLRTLLVSNEIKAQIARLKVVDGLEDAAELLAEKSIRTVEKDGKFQVQVVDAQGNMRHKIVGTEAVPMTVADLMDEIKQTRPAFFQADPKGGVNITPGNGGAPRSGGQVNPWAKDTFNRTAQAVITNTNPQLARQLKAQAGVA